MVVRWPYRRLPGAGRAVRRRRVQVQKIVPLAEHLRGDEHVARQHADIEFVRLQQPYYLAVEVAPPLRQGLARPRRALAQLPPEAQAGQADQRQAVAARLLQEKVGLLVLL